MARKYSASRPKTTKNHRVRILEAGRPRVLAVTGVETLVHVWELSSIFEVRLLGIVVILVILCRGV